jgi:hypothetical protein
MLTSSWRRLVAIAVASAALVGVGIESAAAAEPTFPAGVACEFGVDFVGVDNRKVHEFTDADGNVVRLIAGLAGPVTFTNADTGTMLTLPANGAAWKILNPNGPTSTFMTMGHLVLILFPSDVPAGPSTTLYVGRVVFTVDNTTGVFTLQETRGTATDLCAALSG